jgi:hypothetical protein
VCGLIVVCSVSENAVEFGASDMVSRGKRLASGYQRAGGARGDFVRVARWRLPSLFPLTHCKRFVPAATGFLSELCPCFCDSVVT